MLAWMLANKKHPLFPFQTVHLNGALNHIFHKLQESNREEEKRNKQPSYIVKSKQHQSVSTLQIHSLTR